MVRRAALSQALFDPFFSKDVKWDTYSPKRVSNCASSPDNDWGGRRKTTLQFLACSGFSETEPMIQRNLDNKQLTLHPPWLQYENHVK